MKNKILFLFLLLAAAGAIVYFMKFSRPSASVQAPASQPAPAAAAPKAPAPAASAVAPQTGEGSLTDQIASVFHIEGTARILKKGSESWAPIQVGTIVQPGDQIKTEADGIVELHYDAFFLNTAKITPNSLAEFTSIEPTRIFVSSGAIYSSLNGLPEGSTYDVITPTAVGGVRSTVFSRSYDPSTQSDETVVIEGTVYLATGTSDLSKAADSEIIHVEQEQGFAFTGQQLISGDVSSMKPEALTPEAVEDFKKSLEETRLHASAFAGGDDKLEKVHQEWQAMKTDEKKMASIKAKMEIARFHQKFEEKKYPLVVQTPAPSPETRRDSTPAPAPAPAQAPASNLAAAQTAAPEAPKVTGPTSLEAGATDVPENATEDELAVEGDVFNDGKRVGN